MYTPSPDWSLLARYFAGEAAEEDRRVVERWAAEDEGHRRLVRHLERIWEASEEPRDDGLRDPLDLEANWAEVIEMAAAGDDSGGVPPRPLRLDRASARRARSPWPSGLRVLVAVVAVVAVLGGAWALREVGRGVGAAEAPRAEPLFREVVTEPGQRARIELADGTGVLLNVDSRLRIAATFNGEDREVTLQGEAYFDVAPDPASPFIVRTEQAAVEVRGTAFGVTAYPAERAARVAVAEGAVLLRPAPPAARDTVRLQEGQLAFVSESATDVREGADLDPYLAWTEGRLVFEAAPFEEVMQALERWYGLRVELAAPARGVGRLSGSFGDEPLSEILGSIAATLGLRYERERKRVTFYPA